MNQAFIDGQNLYMNTHSNGWDVDLVKFRIYLKENITSKRLTIFSVPSMKKTEVFMS